MNPTHSRKRALTGAAVAACVMAAAAIVAVALPNLNFGPWAYPPQYSDVHVQGDYLPTFDAEAEEDPAIAMSAPIVTGQNFAGETVTILPGKPTLIVFLAHWCPHCQEELPMLVDWERMGRVPAGLDVIAVATSTSSLQPNYPPSEWLAREEFPSTWMVIADSEQNTALEAFGVSGFPFFALVDANGNVAMRNEGAIPVDDLTSIVRAAGGI